MRTLPRITAALAMGLSALTLAVSVSPAPAFAGEAFYHVTFAQPVTKTRLMAKELLWACDGASCMAVKSTNRAATVCSALAKANGEVLAFNAGPAAFTAGEIATCNGKPSA